MSHVLFLSSYYLGAATANGICARNVVKELNNMGHIVDVICYENNQCDVVPENVHTIDKPCISELTGFCKIADKLRKGFQLLEGDISAALDYCLVARYVDELEKIYSSQCIDAVVAMFFPLECAEALYLFKKKYPDVKAIIYELDSIGDGVAETSVQFLYNRMYNRWLNKLYTEVDNIIVMQSHKGYWDNTFGKFYGDKVKYADIPVLVEKQISVVVAEENVPTSMIYAGLIEKKYRSPSYLLSVLRELDKSTEFAFHFYSKGDCEDEIANTASDVAGIFQHGYVQQNVLDQAIGSADFLVSIGNLYSKSVPSKLISYLSYGKPVVHFSSQKDDVCAQYLRNYPLALVLNQREPVIENAKNLYAFIGEMQGRRVRFLDVAQAFSMNTPKFSAELICAVI